MEVAQGRVWTGNDAASQGLGDTNQNNRLTYECGDSGNIEFQTGKKQVLPNIPLDKHSLKQSCEVEKNHLICSRVVVFLLIFLHFANSCYRNR